MSLWTPGGDVPVEPERPAPTSGTASAPGGPAAGTGGPEGAPIALSEEEVAGILRVRDEMRATPAADVVANHCVGLYQLALLLLGNDGLPPEIAEPLPPILPEARTAIDALGLLVEGLGDRLGTHQAVLDQALAQARMLYVQAASEYGDGEG